MLEPARQSLASRICPRRPPCAAYALREGLGGLPLDGAHRRRLLEHDRRRAEPARCTPLCRPRWAVSPAPRSAAERRRPRPHHCFAKPPMPSHHATIVTAAAAASARWPDVSWDRPACLGGPAGTGAGAGLAAGLLAARPHPQSVASGPRRRSARTSRAGCEAVRGGAAAARRPRRRRPSAVRRPPPPYFRAMVLDDVIRSASGRGGRRRPHADRAVRSLATQDAGRGWMLGRGLFRCMWLACNTLAWSKSRASWALRIVHTRSRDRIRGARRGAGAGQRLA